MIKDYKELKMRSNLVLRFQDYKQDWTHKDKIQKGTFVPQVELHEEELALLMEMCNHAIHLNAFQKEILHKVKALKNNLVFKNAKFEKAFEDGKIESCQTILDSEDQLETILFVLEESRREIKITQKGKAQINLF